MTRRASHWDGQTLSALQERWDRPHIHLYSRIGSTNTLAVQLAGEGAPPGTLVVADEQTAGRGLGARRWHSPRGSGLYLSVVLRPEKLVNPMLLPLLAGMGAAKAVERLIGGTTRVGVKWPNDLIVDDRKAGGVLCEASWASREPNYAVVGVGINVNQRQQDFPDVLRGIATSLRIAVGRPVSRLELADLAIREVEERCADPPEALDWELLKQYDERDWLRDRRCMIERDDATPLQGTVVGIAPDGALLFRPDRGALERVTSGRVLTDELPLPDY